jgi:alkaline phosphatase D
MQRSMIVLAGAVTLMSPVAAQEVVPPPDPASVAMDVPLSPAELLVPYYGELRQRIELPTAPAGPLLPSFGQEITRVAFGSCNHQSRPQDIWRSIAATDPDLFMMIGDNVYGDSRWDGDAALESLITAYAEQSAHEEFQRFRSLVPMLATWDDHDYGLNDAGGVFPFKVWAEEIFETYWGSPKPVRERPGIYHSVMLGTEGQRLQIILLDTRYFRSPLLRAPYQDPRPDPWLGGYLPDASPDAEMLGAAQWDWLARELEKPADLRLIVSSIQILTDAHQFEGWTNMPAERARLLEMITSRDGGGVVLMTGDRHSGGIYNADIDAVTNGEVEGGELWELTSSSLNFAFGTTERQTEREPDPRRASDFIAEENFGLVEVDWQRRELTISLRGDEGEVRAIQTVAWD